MRGSSSRSGLRSRDSLAASASFVDLCAVPELEEPVLELPPPPDVLAFGDSGEVVYTSRAYGDEDADAAPLEFDVEDPEFDNEDEEEYDACAADDLALRMDVPEPGSDEETEAEEVPRSRASVSTKTRQRRKNTGTSQGSVEKASRRSAGETGVAMDPEMAAALCQATEELEALDRKGKEEGFLHVEQVLSVAERARPFLAKLRQSKMTDQDGQAPRLLRAAFALMDHQADATCLLRLARCTLELLRVGTVLQDVGTQGVEAAYLNIARALFKLSKEASNDALFREEGLLEPLLVMLHNGALVEVVEGHGSGSNELRVFVMGVLKNVSNNEDNQKLLVKRGALPALLALLRPTGDLRGSGQEAQLLVQVTALLRNLSASSKRQQQLIDLGGIATLTQVSSMYMSNKELQVNVARVIAKLSQHSSAIQALEQDPAPLQQMARCLREHAGIPTLVLRLTFAFGNLTANSDHLRQHIMFDCDMAGLLPGLLERYWQQNCKLAQANSNSGCLVTTSEEGAVPSDSQETESVLVKLVRLVANVTINPSVGTLVASEASVVEPLLDMLGCKRMAESEELVLSVIAALTNLLYYDSETNLLFSAENKQLLCRLLRPMLLEAHNVEALIETARALGNLSRHPDARQWISELRVDEALAILLAHGDRDLVFYSCGALVNLAADPQTGGRLCREGGLRTKVAAMLHDTLEDDPELLLVGVKVLSNLRLEGDGEEPWQEETLRNVRVAVTHARDAALAMVATKTASAVASAGGQASSVQGPSVQGGLPPAEEMLADLARRLLDSLPLSSQEQVDPCEAGLCQAPFAIGGDVGPQLGLVA